PCSAQPRLLRVQLHHKLLVGIQRYVGTLRSAQKGSLQIGLVELQPGGNGAIVDTAKRIMDRIELAALRADVNNISRINDEARNINGAALDEDRPVEHELARRIARCAAAEAIHHVVETAFEQPHQ